MKKIFSILLVLSHFGIAQDRQKEVNERSHFVCIQSTGVYHDNSGCSTLQLCSGGKIRKTKHVDHLKPCPKCALVRQQYRAGGFTDIKRVLGVKDKKQIRDSLGTAEGTIQRPDGLFIQISGPPNSRTVNTIEFYFNKRVLFQEDTLFSKPFFDRLGLQFEGCRSDTIKSKTPHPVTGKIKKDIIIEYRGCALVERQDNYEDISKYYYELSFLAKESDLSAELEKVQLKLKVDQP